MTYRTVSRYIPYNRFAVKCPEGHEEWFNIEFIASMPGAVSRKEQAAENTPCPRCPLPEHMTRKVK